MAKKEESSKKQDHAKSEKPHGQKTEEPKIQAEKTRGQGKEISQGSGMRTSDDKELGKGKGLPFEDFDEKGMGDSRGWGMGKASQPGMGDKGESSLGKPEGIDLGNLDGIDISNFDPSSSLGKKVAGKGCLPAIIGIIMVVALVLVF